MSRKWVRDLTFQDWVDFIKHNSYVSEYALDKALDNAYFWVGEYLNGSPRTVDYEYFGRGEHFTVNQADQSFIDWIDEVQNAYEWLDEETYDKCKRAYELWKRADNAFADDEDLTDEEWEEYSNLLDEISDEIFHLMKSEYDSAFDDEVQADILMNDSELEDGLFDDYENTYVDTNTWEFHNIEDEEDEDAARLDYDLDEQLELPTL